MPSQDSESCTLMVLVVRSVNPEALVCTRPERENNTRRVSNRRSTSCHQTTNRSMAQVLAVLLTFVIVRKHVERPAMRKDGQGRAIGLGMTLSGLVGGMEI